MIMNNNNVILVCGILFLLSMICIGFQYSLAQTNLKAPELIPDVTSNISLMMTPDLPANLATNERPIGDKQSSPHVCKAYIPVNQIMLTLMPAPTFFTPNAIHK